jgi:tRNA(fMet)-specific endonuclease VapC
LNRVVVDTNVASYLFKGSLFARRFEDALVGAHSHLSFMTIAELRAWAFIRGWGPWRCNLLDEFIARFEIIHSDEGLCQVWGSIRAHSRAHGHEISAQDAWVAATALALDAPLATNNRRDYEHIPGLELLDT